MTFQEFVIQIHQRVADTLPCHHVTNRVHVLYCMDNVIDVDIVHTVAIRCLVTGQRYSRTGIRTLFKKFGTSTVLPNLG